jgi:hypothetical protein
MVEPASGRGHYRQSESFAESAAHSGTAAVTGTRVLQKRVGSVSEIKSRAWRYRILAGAAAVALMGLAGGTVYTAVGAETHQYQSATGPTGDHKDTYVGSSTGDAKS